MRTKDELFRAAQREVAAYRQQAVMQAETARRAAYAAHPALAEADSAHMRAGLGLAKAAALGGNMDTARAALTRAEEALAAAVREAGFDANDFKPAYRCPLCEDTGMRGGVPCRCVADAARRLRRDGQLLPPGRRDVIRHGRRSPVRSARPRPPPLADGRRTASCASPCPPALYR